MDLCMMCGRRLAVFAALVGGSLIAIAGVDWCASGIVWTGSACAGAIRSGLGFFG